MYVVPIVNFHEDGVSVFIPAGKYDHLYQDLTYQDLTNRPPPLYNKMSNFFFNFKTSFIFKQMRIKHLN